MLNNTTSIALYDTLGEEASKYVINQTGLSTIACQGDLAAKILKMKIDDKGEKIAHLKNVVAFDKTDDLTELAKEADIKVYSFDEVIAEGKKNTEWKEQVPMLSDCPMFSYTSGTTGDPKGVKLTHQMLVGTVSSLHRCTGDNNKAGPLGIKDTYISYLPSAHSFEACLFSISLTYGMRCGFFSGNVLNLVPVDLPLL